MLMLESRCWSIYIFSRMFVIGVFGRGRLRAIALF